MPKTPKISYDTKFKVELDGSYLLIDHCEKFNVSVFGFGEDASETDQANFNTIEDLDRYIELLKAASKELKAKRGKK